MSQSHPEPGTGFTSFDITSEIRRGLDAAGFTAPRPIQSRTIPAALQGRDILGLAQTGTGKTAAFAVPVLQYLVDEPGAGPRILIVVPTRELALQVAAEIRLLARFTGVKVATIFGGVAAGAQRVALRDRPEIIVACPGRLLDLHRQGVLDLDGIETLVLDEADHMFDMGFLPDLRRIVAAIPEDRQNLLFSATMPREIRALADRILKDPLVVELACSRPASTIEHALYPTEGPGKVDLLHRLLNDGSLASAIVFTRTKHRAHRLARQLVQAGHRAVALQGNMTQGQRDRAMEGFREGRFSVLVATDIAARGIDVAGVSLVVNFDVPTTPDAYTHRIGRTGRSERRGKACTFVTREDHSLIRDIERRIGASIPRRSPGAMISADRAGIRKGTEARRAGEGRPRWNGRSGARPRKRRAA